MNTNPHLMRCQRFQVRGPGCCLVMLVSWLCCGCQQQISTPAPSSSQTSALEMATSDASSEPSSPKSVADSKPSRAIADETKTETKTKTKTEADTGTETQKLADYSQTPTTTADYLTGRREYDARCLREFRSKLFAGIDPATAANADELLNLQQALIAWLGPDFECTPHEQRYVVADIRNFTDSCAEQKCWDLLEQFHAWFAQQTHLPNWIRYQVRGEYFARLGWEQTEWSEGSQVAAAGQQPHLMFQKAAGYLRKSHEINPLFPESAAELMRISQFDPKLGSVDEWFAKALAGQPDYLPAYQARLERLLPHHGGSVDQMVAFARASIGKEPQFENMVPFVLILCHRMIATQVAKDDEARVQLLSDKTFFSELSKVLTGYIRSQNVAATDVEKLSRRYFWTIKAILSLQWNEMQAADQAFSALGEKPHHGAIDELEINETTFAVFRCQAYALFSEFEMDANNLTELMGTSLKQRLKNRRTIQQLTEQVLQDNDHPISSLFFKRAQQQVRLEHGFQYGVETELPFDQDLILWKSSDVRRLKFDEENGLFIKQENLASNLQLSSIVQTPGSKSIGVEFNFDSPNDSYNAVSDHVIAIVIGTVPVENPPPGAVARYFAVGLSATPVPDSEFASLPANLTNVVGQSNVEPRGRLVFGELGLAGRMRFFDVPLRPEKNELHVNHCQQYLEVFLNDQFIMRTAELPLLKEADTFQLLLPALMNGKQSVYVSNIRLRKWSDEPPPLRFEDELLAHYSRQLEKHATNKWFAFWLAQAIHQKQNYQSAIDKYESAIELGLSPSVAGFYLGDAYELSGDMTNAVKWYQIAANRDTAQLFRFCEQSQNQDRVPTNSKPLPSSTPEQWAAFRLAWRAAFPTEDAPDSASSDDVSKWTVPAAPGAVAWLDDLLQAQQLANKTDFQSACSLARGVLKHCDSTLEAIVMKMIQSYEAQQIYHPPSNSAPLYRLVPQPVPFFQTIDEIP